MRGVLKSFVLGTVALVGPQILMAGPVNINEADAETLARELDGIGPALAEAIIRDREENGEYESPEQITRVRGIGPRVLEDNREYILVKDESAASD
jgi:competence protein ComEA